MPNMPAQAGTPAAEAPKTAEERLQELEKHVNYAAIHASESRARPDKRDGIVAPTPDYWSQDLTEVVESAEPRI